MFVKRSPEALYLLFSHYPSDPRPRRQAEALRDAGWRVTVLSLGVPGEPPVLDVEGVRVETLSLTRYRGQSVSSYLRKYARFVRWAAGKVVRSGRRFDFVHVHTPPDFLAFASLPARWRGAGTLLDVHDPTPELYEERFGGRRARIVQVAKLVEKASAGAVTEVLTVNEQFRNLLISRGVAPDRISVVLNLPDERIFWNEIIPEPPDQPVLAYHGTLVPRYGPQVLLEAAAILAPRIPNLSVRIIGDGDQKADLIARAEMPDLKGRVYFSPDRLPVHRIPGELSGVSAGVVANRAEGFTRLVLPTKLLEYMALGIPAVVTRTETIDYYFRPGEVLRVDRPDPALVAQALEPILEDRRLAREAAHRGRQFFDRHRWVDEAAVYVALAERLARGGSRAAGTSPTHEAS